MYKTGFIWDSEIAWNRENPFDGKRSDDFAYYTEEGRGYDLEIYIANYKWYEKGKLTKAWFWNGEEWEKKHDVELDLIYDKFKYDLDTRNLKEEMAEELPVLNDLELEEICKDKLKTYNLFSERVGETRKATQENAEQMFEKFEKIVYKPRYGFAGHGVEVLHSLEEFSEPDNPEDFIIQRFIDTDGFEEWGVEGPHDLRTIVINGEIQDGNYVRVPDEGLISNISRGGHQKYIRRSELPDSVIELIDEIKQEFERFQPAIFSVDFMFDKDMKPWIVELNSKPGTYFNHPEKDEELEKKKIKNILKTLNLKAEEFYG
ncbi:MAG: glutathione synthase/RimK-type ligase-like ATP-grasp enzyme [Colwellia polaris]|jgi:glutathione synthase/RimK-type ligase-like ATP-grasp enzyme